MKIKLLLNFDDGTGQICPDVILPSVDVKTAIAITKSTTKEAAKSFFNPQCSVKSGSVYANLIHRNKQIKWYRGTFNKLEELSLTNYK